MKEKDIISIIQKLPKVRFFVRSEDNEISWQAGAVSDRIKISFIDSITEDNGIMILKSAKGTWFGDKVVYFSIATGSVSIDNKVWYAAGPKITISHK